MASDNPHKWRVVGEICGASAAPSNVYLAGSRFILVCDCGCGGQLEMSFTGPSYRDIPWDWFRVAAKHVCEMVP